MKRSRYPKFTRGLNGEPLCRGCKKPVPKGRWTWCSTACWELHNPQIARAKVFARDKGVCCMCGCDTERLQRRLAQAYRYPDVDPNKYYLRGPVFNREAYNRAIAIWQRHVPHLNEARKKRIAAFKAAGWPYRGRDWWDADHIIPHSEGGTHDLSNLRTLCVLCHKKRTREWHKQRKKTDQQLLGI